MNKYNLSSLTKKGRTSILKEAREDGVIIQECRTNGEIISELVLVSKTKFDDKTKESK